MYNLMSTLANGTRNGLLSDRRGILQFKVSQNLISVGILPLRGCQRLHSYLTDQQLVWGPGRLLKTPGLWGGWGGVSSWQRHSQQP